MANGLLGDLLGQSSNANSGLFGGGIFSSPPSRAQRRESLLSDAISTQQSSAGRLGAAFGGLIGTALSGVGPGTQEEQRNEAIKEVQGIVSQEEIDPLDPAFGPRVAELFTERNLPDLAAKSLLQSRALQSQFASEPKERRVSVTGGSELANQLQSLYGVSVPEGETYEVGLTGDRVTQINRLGASNVQNIDMGDSSESEFNERFAKLDAETLSQAGEVGARAVRNRGRLDRLDQLLKDSPQGFEGGVKQIAGRFGIATEGVDEIQATQALVNSIVPEQRPEGSGPMSDADLQFFIEVFPRILNQEGGNEKIMNTLRAINEYDAQAAEIVGRLRRDEIDRAEAFDQLRERENPLSSIQDDIDQGPYTVETPEGTFEFDTKGEADSFRREAGIE